MEERYTVEYKNSSYHILRDGNEVNEFMGYNITMAYLMSHGVIHSDATNLMTTAHKEVKQ